MDYSRPDLADRLAAEYVLGTLSAPARRRFNALLPAHPALRQAVESWQQRLMPMLDRVAPVEPSAAVWPRIEQRLFGLPTPHDHASPWWQRLSLWRGIAGTATVAALALGVVLSQPPAPQAPIVIVMNADPGAAAIVSARFVAGLSADGRALVLRPLGDIALAPGRALELWAVPGAGAPRSLGLVSARAATTILRGEPLAGAAALAVSLEPSGGSPTGAPTGPILSSGKIQL